MKRVKKLNTRDVRKAKIIEAACSGIPIGTIAENFECGIGTVERAIRSPEGQKQLKNVIHDCEVHINNQLPELLELSFKNLKDVLTAPFANRTEKIRASEIVLKTALKLSEITNKA